MGALLHGYGAWAGTEIGSEDQSALARGLLSFLLKSRWRLARDREKQ